MPHLPTTNGLGTATPNTAGNEATNKKPKTIPELVVFYYTFVKPLYASVQTTNTLPIEVLFEINAAFDHLTRHWAYGENEAEVVSKVCSHLKRGCLDIFKIAVKESRRQFDELRLIDTSAIEHGEFDRRLIELWQRIKKSAEHARVCEGDPTKDDSQAVHAFELWLPVWEDCVAFEKDIYGHDKLDWAHKRQSKAVWRERWIGGVLFGGVVGGILSAIVIFAAQFGWERFYKWQSPPSSELPSASPPPVNDAQKDQPSPTAAPARTQVDRPD